MESPFTLSIDWLAFTIPASNSQETMQVVGGEWSKAKAGFRGYPLSWIRADGLRGVGKLGTNAPRRPNEIHVDLSGGIVSTYTLQQIRSLLLWVIEKQGHLTRIDCALDDRGGTVPLATIAQAKELQLVRHAFNLAMREWEWCRENPMHRVSMEQVRNEVDRWLTTEEEERLMAASSPWLREIMVFALNTGMRQGEILNLQWQEVDFTRSTLIVMKSKNGTRRTIPLNAKVYELLAAKQAVTDLSRGPVFKTSLGNLLQVRFLVREFCEARNRAGIPDFRFHDMRHTFATRLVQRGVDLYKVQRLLGHKTNLMTQRYAHHSPESLREGVNVLDECRPERVSTNLAQGAASEDFRSLNVS